MPIEYTLNREGFTTELVIRSLLSGVRISAIVSKPGNERISVEAQVIHVNGDYIPVIKSSGGRFEGNDAFYHSRAIMHAIGQMRWYADDMSDFEVNSQTYVDKIQEYLDERSVEGLALYLPLRPVAMGDDRVRQVIKMVSDSGLLGDITTTGGLGQLDVTVMRALIIVVESMDDVHVSDSSPFTSLANTIKEIIERPS